MGNATSAGPRSDVLDLIAGDWAGVIAGIWQFPHAGFFALPSAKRHLAAAAVTKTPALLDDPERLRGILEGEAFNKAAAALIGDTPGLRRLFHKLGPELLSAELYEIAIEMLADPVAKKTLFHTRDPRAEHIIALYCLPAQYRSPAVFRFTQTPSEALLFRRLLDRAHQQPATVPSALRNTLMAAPSADAFWQRLYTASRVFFGFSPVDALPGFRVLHTRPQLEEARSRLGLCLPDYAGLVARGDEVFLEWAGEAPAVVRVKPRFGRRGQAIEVKGERNADLPFRELMQIQHALSAAEFDTDLRGLECHEDLLKRILQLLPTFDFDTRRWASHVATVCVNRHPISLTERVKIYGLSGKRLDGLV